MANNSDPIDASKFNIESFAGGLRRNVDPTKLQDDQYPLLVNARSRYGTLKPIKLPKKIEEFPTGLMQGCYAQDNYVIVFCKGEAYLKDFKNTGSSFKRLKDFSLSSTEEYIFAEAVPSSFFNFDRW